MFRRKIEKALRLGARFHFSELLRQTKLEQKLCVRKLHRNGLWLKDVGKGIFEVAHKQD